MDTPRKCTLPRRWDIRPKACEVDENDFEQFGVNHTALLGPTSHVGQGLICGTSILSC